MQLIYCANNGTDDIVLGWHDDSQNVSASAYTAPAGSPTGLVRVIPYPQAVSSLTKIGPPPVLGDNRFMSSFADTRPYAQPTETKQILLDFAAQVRWQTVVAGTTFNSNLIHTDRESQALIANLAAHAATLATTDPIDFTQDNVHYPMTAADVIALNTQINARIQQCRTIEAACIADLNSPTPTILTYADVEAKFAGVTLAASPKRK